MTEATRCAWACVLALASCTVQGNATDAATDTTVPPVAVGPPPSSPFAPTTTRVMLEVDYGPGAEPYVGEDVWRTFGESVGALFEGKKEIVYPASLDRMERLDDVRAGSFTTADLVAIAARHRATAPAAGTAAFYVVFVDGVYVDEGGIEQPKIFGLAIGRTGAIAMFKRAVSPIAEQAALVHELGHAVGLVDLGVPATSAHVDHAHARHCTNERCVMFWANERQEHVRFGPECLADARELAQALE